MQQHDGNDTRTPFDISARLDAHRRELDALRWEGSFRDYFELVSHQPRLAQLSHARLNDMIHAAGLERTAEGTRDETTRYNFFADELYGIEEPIARIVEYFKSAAQRLEVRKRILLLMGPVGGGKSTIVTMLKRGLEEWTRTEQGAVYAIKDCPMHEEPLHLIPAEMRPDIEKHYGIYIEGDLCPQCRYRLEHTYAGRHEEVRVERVVFTEKERVGIGTFSPSDPKSQDVTELTGSIDLSTIGEVGVESDPRAYRFDGELNIANRGMMEFIEILKCVTPQTYIPTADGLMQIAELAPPTPDAHRDFPFVLKMQTRDGVRSTSHIIYNGKGETVRLRTRKGFTLEGAPDHRVLVVCAASGAYEWRALRDARATDRVCINRRGYFGATDAPRLTEEMIADTGKLKEHLPERLTEDLARLLGYFVAEGWYLRGEGGLPYGIGIANQDEEVVADVRRVAASLGLNAVSGGRCRTHIWSRGLARLFHNLGLTGRRAAEKQMPPLIRRAPQGIMSAFLRAYFDGDGTVTSLISCTTASEKLAEQMQLVLLNYGIVAKRCKIHNKRYERDYHQVQIDGENVRIFEREIGFGIKRKREAAARLASDPRSSHRDAVPNFSARWAEIGDALRSVAARRAEAVAAPYRERAGVRQMIGGGNYEQLWRFSRGASEPSFAAAHKLVRAAEAHVEIPPALRDALGANFFHDEIAEITAGYDDLWDFCVPANHSYIGNGFVNHNCDEKFLYSLLTLSQEQNIKTGRFAMIYADEVILSHTNENEYVSFAGNRKSEALQDRIILVKVPYNLRVSQEERIYSKLLGQSEVLRNVHIAPNTLRVAAMFAVMTRLEEPKRQSIDITKKMKLYDGEDVEGYKSKDVRELRDEASREGMDGISPRYVINRLSGALVRDGVTCINPIDALRAIKDGFEQHTGINAEQRDRYLNLISAARKEYDEIAKTEVQRAFVYSFEEMARTLCNNYLDNVEAYCNKDRIKDALTDEELEPDEQLMRSIEEQIGVSENAKNTFRQEILIRISSYARKGKQFDYLSHERLKEAIERKIFTDLKDVVKITTSSKTPDPDQTRRINDVVDRLVREHGYCSVCANELLSYVGTLLSR